MISIRTTKTDGKVIITSTRMTKSYPPNRCEYILYRGLYRTSYARISRGIITDTELQIGQFMLPRHGARVTDESEVARYLRCRKEELPEDHVGFSSWLLWFVGVLIMCVWLVDSGSRWHTMAMKIRAVSTAIFTMYSAQ